MTIPTCLPSSPRSLLRPPRPLLLLFLLLLDGLLLAAFGAVIWLDNAANRGITFTPDPEQAPIPWADGPRVGVNLYHLHLEPDPAVVTRTLELVRDLGVRYVRMQVPWEDIEIHGWNDFEDRRNLETRGVVSAWAKYDRLVELASSLGLELVLRLDRPPDWSRTQAIHHPAYQEGLERDANSTGPPDDFRDYSAFVSRVVGRYRGQVRFFQLWNEPNLKNEWNWQEPDPEAFTQLLRFGYTAAKTANPEAVVLFPSLAPADGLDKRSPMTELEYLERVYQAGGKDYFDLMSVQAYGLGQPPDEHRYVWLRPWESWSWTRPIDTRTDVSRIVLIREVMEQYGDSDKAVWVSEFGWNSAPETIPEARRMTWGPPVSEQQKADYLVGMLERARDEWPWVGVMHVWMLRYGGYQDPDPADPTPYFALVQRDWTRLPAYTRLQSYLEQPAVAGVGVHSWQHPAIEPVEGGWKLRFRGSRATLVGGLSGDLERVTLDGTTPTTLERDGLSTGEQTLTASPRVLDGEAPGHIHTLEIIAPGADPPDRFAIARPAPVPWFWVLAPTALVGMLMISGALTVQALFGSLRRE